MIQLLATRYTKTIALILFLGFYLSMVAPLYAANKREQNRWNYIPKASSVKKLESVVTTNKSTTTLEESAGAASQAISNLSSVEVDAGYSGGPTQPEMASFKSVGTDNMVSLFSGDFSYNIPLLDVGGYPVNIFYDGGITMEQEASWVGLGWNINPGNINRNMRGMPDDFNGEDTIIEKQNMKPNKTWGINLGSDLELLGIKNKLGLNVNLGVSFNNYLGPALELGLKGGVGFQISDIVKSEKTADDEDTTVAIGDIGGSVNASGTLNSRNGFTFSPNLSLTARLFGNDRQTSVGLTAATSYNSRYGIRDLHIAGQLSFNKVTQKTKENADCSITATNYKSSNNLNLYSSSISFAKPSYLPAIRMPIVNNAISGHFQLGGAIFGSEGSVEAEIYSQKAKVSPAKIILYKPAVGYMYYQNAVNNPDAVMDFSRLNDKEVTAHTSIISAPQYSYDVFSIQGEGTGGSIRAYRNDLGYVRDNYTTSQDESGAMGVDIGVPGQFGGNFNIIKTPTVIYDWRSGNRLKDVLKFKSPNTGLSETVYFRNPGENSVLNPEEYARIGGLDMVRFHLGGDGFNPTVEPVLERFSKTKHLLGTTTVTNNLPQERKKRTQVINFLTAYDASKVGLDAFIKSYNSQTILAADTLVYKSLPRIDEYRKPHHISQINVTEADGKRYIYGIPVYNKVQRDFTFSVDQAPTADNKVNITATQMTVGSTLVQEDSKVDGYVQVREMPPFANSFLLNGLLSPDYVDVTGNGITEDDLGTAVKFNYTRIEDGSGNPLWHKWRTPLTSGSMANYNGGNLTEKKDDKGIITYGERESWYLHSIESKTMIAIFTTEDRDDGNGTANESGGIQTNDNSLKRLKKIDLYNKADIKANGLSGAKSIKTVHFEYSYVLCNSTPDNPGGGKLTLDNIYFTYNGKARANKNQYVFSYTTAQNTGNPSYEFNASDRWGNYKPASANPAGMKNHEFPYTKQDKTDADSYAGAWALKRILLPSGGQIEVEYESDDYAFVQNKRAAQMMSIAGFGNTPTTISNRLYDVIWPTIKDNYYLFVNIPDACTTKAEVHQKYLQGLDQIAVKMAVQMPKGVEYVSAFGLIDDYGIYDAGKIWIRVKGVDGTSPFALAALEYLREQLPGQAFPAYDVSESTGLKQIGEMLGGMLDALVNAFKDPLQHFKSKGFAQHIVEAKSFVRLNNPSGFKYGGGNRVKAVKLKDNWNAMTEQYTSTYGQSYDYTTTEVFNGEIRAISSGVASYEPSIGAEENPFYSIVMVANKLPLGPASYGSVEMPILESFFPAPTVGYSKVTVRSITGVTPDENQKSRSGIGRQVTEFYTAKDFPVYYNHTSFDPSTDRQAHKNSTTAFFYKYAFDSRALSQGFIVATNDMHGKMKSQSSYADNDTSLRVNYTENFYRNTGVKGFDEKFDFVYASEGGAIHQGNMGIDVELMTDLREFKVNTESREIQAQVDLFPVLLPIWLPFIWPVVGSSENTYRAVTTTKVINYHSILDSVVVIDKGSQVSTKNLLYDAETGEVVVNRTNNEFDQPIYSTTYPAHWAYSGMGLAYKNIDAVYMSVSFSNGRLTTPGFDLDVFESGDELYVFDEGTVPEGVCPANLASDATDNLWVYDTYKNSSAFIASRDLLFMDKDGKLFTRNNVSFRIIRSGKRNLLNNPASSITSMVYPVTTGTTQKIEIDEYSKVLNSSAVEYREKWHTDIDVLQKIIYGFELVTTDGYCFEKKNTEEYDCNGEWPRSINPYLKGLVGNYKPYKNLVFYGNRAGSQTFAQTNISQDGYLESFSPYWNFNSANRLIPAITNTNWVWNSMLTQVNSIGAILETKDALGIYSSTQWGFKKQLPVAVTSNSRSREMINESFEDYSYNSYLNADSPEECSSYLKMDISGMQNSSILNTDGLSFNAHSGKHVLAIEANSTAATQLQVSGTAIDSFNLLFEPTSVNRGALHLGGQGSTRILDYCNGNLSATNATETVGNRYTFGVSESYFLGTGWNCTSAEDYSLIMHSFFKANVTGTYGFTTFIREGGGEYTFWIREAKAPGEVDLSTDSPSGFDYLYTYTYPPDGSPPQTVVMMQNGFNVPLCEGRYYEIIMKYKPHPIYLSGTYWPQGSTDLWCGVTVSAFLNQNPIHETLLQNELLCSFNKPIPAKDSMVNPIFTVPANKQMILSGWVRQSCNTTPCTEVSYTDNKIVLNFYDVNGQLLQTLENEPSGAIIEQWQRYESYFTAPVGTSYATLSFVNSSSQPIYFDDVRILPFNANMKSYVYDPITLRLVAELDENNYARFYEYDEEGTLIRTKAETKEGIKTITETRSAKQKNITTFK